MTGTIIPGVPYTWSPATGLWTAPGRSSLTGPAGPAAPPPPPVVTRDSLVYGSYVPGLTTVSGYPYGVVGIVDPTVTWTDVYPASTVDGYIYIDSTATIGGTLANPIKNVRYWGKVKPRVTGNVYFSNCQFNNRRPEDMWMNSVGSNGGSIENFGANPPHLFLKDCLFDAKAWFDAGLSNFWGHPQQMGIHGSNHTLERCELRNMQDGFENVGPTTASAASAAYTQLIASWVHRNFYVKPWTVPVGYGFPGEGGPGPGVPASNDTHSDADQFNTGGNVEISFSNLGGRLDTVGYLAANAYNSGDDCHNSAVIIQQEVDASTINHVGNVRIHDNWMSGGAATINANLKNGNTLSDCSFLRNKIARRGTGTWGGAGYYIYRNGGLAASLFGSGADQNVIWDPDTTTGSINGTGIAVPIVNYPGT